MSEKNDANPKTYRPPRLKEYGSIRKVTQASTDKVRPADGIKGKFNKT